MKPRVAIIAPGAMGSAIARRLDANGLQVLTSITGRSAASVARAHECGMHHRQDEELAHADIFLSIVPPAEAIGLARRFAPLFKEHGRTPVYVDCNAINPQNTQQVARIVLESGAAFVDGGIIGGPPKPDTPGPVLYCSGSSASALDALAHAGLRLRILPGDIGAASALKMSYAGITKGLTALASTMMLGASRNGVADALYAELSESQPHLLNQFSRSVPDMYGKAYRWVAEMQEIAGFLEPDTCGRQLFDSAAQVYERLAQDHRSDQAEIGALTAFLAKGGAKPDG
jgi:3-hydroxyisobutyrate dehydrogenase-like beta-hydroxyacid dehydrogenase